MKNLRSPQFGAILFRASEVIAKQGGDVFNTLGFAIPASRISIVLAINKNGPCSSTSLSEHIGISRQLIESRLKAGVKDGTFITMVDKKDTRKRIYDFAENIKEEVQRIIEIMINFETVYEELWKEMGVDLESSLLLMEKALKKYSLEERLLNEFPKYNQEVRS